jgi:hypothetical protein
MLAARSQTSGNWLGVRTWPEAEVRRCRRVLWLALLVYATLLWFAVPHGIGTSWRECDTQAIARNFVADGFDPLRPRVDWRGDTDGAVECEFPLYQLLVAVPLAVFGDVEWPGRVLSLLAMVGAALALHRLLALRVGPQGALAGVIAFLGTGCAVMLGARVMPDGLSIALGLGGLVAFVRYLDTGRGLPLLLATLAVAAAALTKPLALQLGLVMFGWTWAMKPERLRDWRLWAAFVAIVGTVAAWLVHAAGIHAETGLSFGVVSGGDSKFPDVSHLLDIGTHAQLAGTTAKFGFSALGALAAVAVCVRRRVDASAIVLAVAVFAGLLVSLRYSCDAGLGPHYHVFAAALAAWCVALAWPSQARPWLWAALIVLAGAWGGWRLRDERGMRKTVIASPYMAASHAIRERSAPEELIVVRSDKTRADAAWNRPQNFEDPRVFYQAQRRGWVLPADGFDAAELARFHLRGATFVFDPLPETAPPETKAWLAEHGEVVFAQNGFVVYRLQPRRQ